MCVCVCILDCIVFVSLFISLSLPSDVEHTFDFRRSNFLFDLWCLKADSHVS